MEIPSPETLSEFWSYSFGAVVFFWVLGRVCGFFFSLLK